MFDYSISPNAVPPTVSPVEPSQVTLMITVTNKGSKPAGGVDEDAPMVRCSV